MGNQALLPFGPGAAATCWQFSPLVTARSYMRGLVSGLERKNEWTLAEYAGDGTPEGMQRLLNAAGVDEDKSGTRWAGM